MEIKLYNVLPTQEEALEPELWEFIHTYDYPQILHSYTISTYGRVYNIYENKYVAPRVLTSENKYLNVSIKMLEGGMRTFDIHRLMLRTFIPNDNFNNLVCNHKDGVKCHNWIWNLEWTTTRGNTIHAIDNGLIPTGTNRANGKVPEEFIHEICKLLEAGYSTLEIRGMLKPPVECNMRRLVQNIKNGHCHSIISRNYDFSNLK